MIERFSIKEILELVIMLQAIIVFLQAYIIILARNDEKDRKIIYNVLKKISGDLLS